MNKLSVEEAREIQKNIQNGYPGFCYEIYTLIYTFALAQGKTFDIDTFIKL